MWPIRRIPTSPRWEGCALLFIFRRLFLEQKEMEANMVIIHARFAPDGTIVEISERPASLSPQEWYNFLCDKAGTSYQALMGGRGVFRLDRAQVDGLKAESAAA